MFHAAELFGQNVRLFLIEADRREIDMRLGRHDRLGCTRRA